MSYASVQQQSQSYNDWLRGWKEWARTRKRGRMAQFIVEKLEEGKQAKWLSISKGLFELTEWHLIAKEWFGEKPRNSEEVDAPCMLRKGLPRAFPGLEEVKEKSRKEGTQYRSRVFQASPILMQEVFLHINSHGAYYPQQEYTSGDYAVTHGGVHYGPEGYTIPNTSTTVSAQYYPMIKREFPVNVSHNHVGTIGEVSGRMQLNGDPTYLQSQPYSSHTNDIDLMAEVIASTGNTMETMETSGGGGGSYQPTGASALSNGWYTNSPAPVTSNVLSQHQIPNSPPVYNVDNVGGTTAGYIGSPQALSYPHQSPLSSHSPRISPEPGHHLSTSSYPSSVPDLQYPSSVAELQSGTGGRGVASGVASGTMAGTIISNGPVELSPPTVQSPIIVTDDVADIMEVKALPNSSPMEGGGHMALVFYQPLPRGQKTVYFISPTHLPYCQMEQAIDENPHTLSCAIPKYPYAEEVELRVYNDQQPIASTTFRFYQQISSSPEMLLHLLNSQLQSQFHVGSGAQGGVGGATGGGASGQTTYNGYIPSSMYQLLLGACRLGCEPLVYSLLCSPIMENISGEQLKEAEECATANGHSKLADHLHELFILHDMTVPSPYLSSRGGEGNEEENEGQRPVHAPAYYDEIDQLDQGGDTPQERAETVLNQLMAAIRKADLANDEAFFDKEEGNKEEEEEKGKETESPPLDDITPTVETMATLSVTDSAASPTEKSPKRRLSSTSRLIRQTNSISDDDNDRKVDASSPPMMTDAVKQSSSPTRRESADQVTDLPVHGFKKLPITQMSDADSAIGLSFDDESLDTRRRSSLQMEFGSNVDVQGCKLTPTSSIEVANSLDWESALLVSNDYPTGQERKMFHKGDQIVQIGDHSTRNMSAKEFGELLQSEAINGTTIYFIPAAGTNSEKPFPVERLLYRSQSDQSLLSTNPRVNQLLNTKTSNSQWRSVVIPSMGVGYGLNVIGGKTVGIFVNDARGTLQLSQGDQIMSINGRTTHGLSLYDVNQILSSNVGSLELMVAENKGKFSSVRDQVELDSFYVRSLIDHTPSTSREMTLTKGMLLRVVNTFSNPNHWLAWSVDEASGNETYLRKIPTPQSAQKISGSASPYERVRYSESQFLRPVCVIGAKSYSIVESLSKDSLFKLCTTLEDVLKTSAEGTQHPVVSVKDAGMIQLLSSLQPIVLQVSCDKSPVTKQFDISSKISIDATLSESGSGREAMDHINRIQSQPVWKPVGLIR